MVKVLSPRQEGSLVSVRSQVPLSDACQYRTRAGHPHWLEAALEPRSSMEMNGTFVSFPSSHSQNSEKWQVTLMPSVSNTLSR